LNQEKEVERSWTSLKYLSAVNEGAKN